MQLLVGLWAILTIRKGRRLTAGRGASQAAAPTAPRRRPSHKGRAQLSHASDFVSKALLVDSVGAGILYNIIGMHSVVYSEFSSDNWTVFVTLLTCCLCGGCWKLTLCPYPPHVYALFAAGLIPLHSLAIMAAVWLQTGGEFFWDNSVALPWVRRFLCTPPHVP